MAPHFLETYDSDKPFCLIVSLVNPHDVLAYPGSGAVAINGVPLYQAGGYQDSEFMHLPIDRPPTWNEDLSTKPRAQSQFRVVSNAGTGVINADSEELQLGYCRFYAHLAQTVDKQILQVLEALNRSRFSDDTLIVRISDHGDMAMAHGLQRQKMFNSYEETLNIPFIIAHPHLFEGCQESDALVSLIDLLPTLSNLAGVPDLNRWIFKGRDLSPILSNPKAEVQDVLHFTYEDLYFFVPAASRRSPVSASACTRSSSTSWRPSAPCRTTSSGRRTGGIRGRGEESKARSFSLLSFGSFKSFGSFWLRRNKRGIP